MSDEKNSKEPKDSKTMHSANSWETVDLGDADRKQKFLRLMGASKKEHQGRFVIGDQDPVHSRTKQDTSKMCEQLEEQYEQGMEHRRLGGRRGHIGLGFHQEEQKDEKTEDKSEEKNEETGEEEISKDSRQSEQEEGEKRKHSEEGEEESEEKVEDDKDESPAKKMKLNFVKASS